MGSPVSSEGEEPLPCSARIALLAHKPPELARFLRRKSAVPT